MDKKRDSFFLAKKEKTNRNISNEQIKKKRHDKFNETRKGLENIENEKKDKKPFDKKTYRLKKYSKKYKLEQWEEQRKKKMLRNYYKSLENEPSVGNYKPVSFDEENGDDSQTSVGRFVKHPDVIEEENSKKEINSSRNKDPFWKAKEKYNKIKQEKLVKQQTLEREREERKQKLQEYKKKKHERFKKLSKKTKKGQPMMKGRLELLLDKIKEKST